MRAYRELFGHRTARWPLVASSLSRLTPGMMALAIVLLVREGGYAYAVAGLVTAGHQIGVAVASPVQGRLADRYGQPTVLVPDAVAYLIGIVSLGLLVAGGASVALLTGVALASGLVYPPTTACARTLLGRLFPTGRLRETAFAVSTIAVELGFILGPLLAVAVWARFGGAWAVAAAGAAGCAGAIGYAATAAAREVPRRPRSSDRAGALRSPGIRVMVVALGAVAVVFGVIEIAVPAVAEFAGSPRSAGALLAAIAAGSLAGALVYGARSWPGTVATRLRVLVVIMTVGLVAVPLTTDSLPLFAVGLFVGGLFLGPTTICAFQLIDDLALPGTQTEAQSWTQTAVVAGMAFGLSASGLAVDAGGPTLALLTGAGCVAVGALVINLGNGRLRTPPAPRAEATA